MKYGFMSRQNSSSLNRGRVVVVWGALVAVARVSGYGHVFRPSDISNFSHKHVTHRFNYFVIHFLSLILDNLVKFSSRPQNKILTVFKEHIFDAYVAC